MSSPEKKSKIVEVTGPSIHKETESIKIEDKENNTNLESSLNLNESKDIQTIKINISELQKKIKLKITLQIL